MPSLSLKASGWPVTRCQSLLGWAPKPGRSFLVCVAYWEIGSNVDGESQVWTQIMRATGWAQKSIMLGIVVHQGGPRWRQGIYVVASSRAEPG